MVKSNTVSLVVTSPAPSLTSLTLNLSATSALTGQAVSAQVVALSFGSVLKGVTVYLFVNGVIQPGSVITDVNGIATFSLTFAAAGTYSIFASDNTSGT